MYSLCFNPLFLGALIEISGSSAFIAAISSGFNPRFLGALIEIPGCPLFEDRLHQQQDASDNPCHGIDSMCTQENYGKLDMPD